MLRGRDSDDDVGGGHVEEGCSLNPRPNMVRSDHIQLQYTLDAYDRCRSNANING